MGSHDDLYDRLREHIGHRVRMEYYGPTTSPVDIAIECETCQEVLLDAEPTSNYTKRPRRHHGGPVTGPKSGRSTRP